MRVKASMVGILVMAALLLNAAPAAATHSVLCKENVSVCPEGSIYPKAFLTSAVGVAAGTYGEFELPGLVTIGSCTAGKFSGPVGPNAEGPSTGTLEAFFFSSCKPEGCNVNVVAEPGKFAWEWAATGGGNGVITVSKPFLTAICTKFPFSFSCKYSAAALSAEFEHSTAIEALITGKETSMGLVGGTSCLVAKANLRFRTSVQGSHWPLFLTN